MAAPLRQVCDEKLERGPGPSSILAPGIGGFHAELVMKSVPNPLQHRRQFGASLSSGQSGTAQGRPSLLAPSAFQNLLPGVSLLEADAQGRV